MIILDIQKKLQATNGDLNLDIQYTIEKGTFVTIYGASGVGKTSTLRMLAGLLQPDSGSITVNGLDWYNKDQKVNLKPQQRKVGVVFQDYALFPNMTVRENLEFALQKNQHTKRIDELISIVELGELVHRKPETLSGGQKQRVALARALVQEPEILLLDEPLSALDLKIRMKLQDYLLKIHRQYGLTTILISHDISEVVKLSDKVIVLENGTISKQGTPDQIFIDDDISGKFKFIGDVLKIEKQEVVYIITVLIQNSVVKVIAQDSEIEDLQIGDKVMVASKAFNPILYKID